MAVPIKNDDNDDVFDNRPNSTIPGDENSTTLECTTQTEATVPQPQPRKSVPRFRYFIISRVAKLEIKISKIF